MIEIQRFSEAKIPLQGRCGNDGCRHILSMDRNFGRPFVRITIEGRTPDRNVEVDICEVCEVPYKREPGYITSRILVMELPQYQRMLRNLEG